MPEAVHYSEGRLITDGGQNIPDSALTSTGTSVSFGTTADAVQYVKPTGDDTANGLAWGAAKRTLQAAHDALPAGGGVIYTSRHTIAITAVLAITKPVAWKGAGTTVQASGGTFNLVTVTGVGSFSVEGVSFDGNYPTRSVGGILAVSASQNVFVKGCSFANAPAAAVGLTNVQKAWVEDNVFSNCGGSGVRLHDPGTGNHNDDIWITGNVVDSCQQAAVSGNAAIQTHGTAAVSHRHIHIENNTVTNSGKVGIGADSIDYSRIAGNYVANKAGATGEVIAFTGSDNEISGNMCVSPLGGSGSACILLWAVASRTNDRNRIQHNTCTGGGQGIAFVWGEQAAVINDLTVSRNRCYSNGVGLQSYFASGVTAGTILGSSVAWNNLAGNTSGTSLVTGGVTGTVQTFNNPTSTDARVFALTAAPWDGLPIQVGSAGSASIVKVLVARHLDSTSAGNPELHFVGRFSGTDGQKEGGVGVRRTSTAGGVETFVKAYTDGGVLVESFKARSDGSFEVEGTGAWNGQHMIMGGYHLWIDASARLRIKSGAPTSDTDGTIVGTQS